MNEDLRPKPTELLPVTQQLLRSVEGRTGRPVVIRPDPSIRERGRAVYVVSDPDPNRHLILYDPERRRFLDHLVAHEAGHILHFHEAPEAERRLPVVTHESRRQGVLDLAPHALQLSAIGADDWTTAKMVDLWISGTVAQLSDTPSDIRIERWIWEEHPGLRNVQRRALRDQSHELSEALRPTVEAITPRQVWLASNAMNYALLKSVSELIGDPNLVRPYRSTAPEGWGKRLLASVDFGPNASLMTDRRTTEHWAETMGFARWFEWRHLTHLPADQQHGVE